MSATYYHLYVKTYCSFCKKACDLLTKEKKEYIVTVLDQSPLMDRATKRKYNQETVPIVIEVKADTMEIFEEGEEKPHLDVIKIVEGRLIGGYTELAEHLIKERRSLNCINEEQPDD